MLFLSKLELKNSITKITLPEKNIKIKKIKN